MSNSQLGKRAHDGGEADEEETHHDFSLNNARTVYVEGLPFDATEEDVRLFFEGAGSVSSLRLPRWHDSGRLRGYGHVEFTTAAAANKALELNGNYLGRRFVKVDRPMAPRASTAKISSDEEIVRPPGCKTIFIKNLPYDCTEADIEEQFKVYGKINSVRLAKWGHTNQLKGFGYIEFKKEDSVEIAVRKSGSILLQGRPVSCDFETGKPKGSFRGGTDNNQHVRKKVKT